MKPSNIYLLLALSACTAPVETEKPHPLEAWSDEVMYFIMTDRFADGDRTNNELGWGEYDTTKAHSYHGGDLAGIAQNLDYLQRLGITSIWLTPPVKNAVWSRDSSITGYHGYWASHFAQVDPHLGTLADYQHLAKAMRKRHMRLVQDVVTNHVADYFTYEGNYNPDSVWLNFKKYGQPLQAPFQLNDARKAAHRQAAIYHFTPSIANYQNETQKLNWQMSDLDDLNTQNPKVIEALKKSFRFWIDSVGIDGIRFDTPLYVDHPFWHRFLHDSSSNSKGLKPHAMATGKPDFYTFGETWVHSNPYSDLGEQKAKKYLGNHEKPEMDGILHFPMQQSMQRVFAGGAPTRELAFRLGQEIAHFPHPWQRLHFIDNHDMPRFRAGASETATLQALAFMLSIPGIPVIYYGTEQGITETRGNMFGKLDTNSLSFKQVQELIALRKSSACFSKGKLEVLYSDSNQAGLLLYKLSHGKEEKWVLMNTADFGIINGQLPLGTRRSGEIKPLYQHGHFESEGAINGRLQLVDMAPKSVIIFEIQPGTGKKAKSDLRITLPTIPDTLFEQRISLQGKSQGIDSLKVLINGNKQLSQTAAIVNGSYSLELSVLNTPAQTNRLVWVGFEKGRAHWLAETQLTTQLPEKLVVQKKDPLADDRGPNGRYQYPLAFEQLRSLDFKKARLFSQGNSMRLEVAFNRPFSTAWNPPLGFDHLQLCILLHWNNETGGNTFKEANYTLPENKKFSRLIIANGWQIQSFAIDSASRPHALGVAPVFRLLSNNSMEFTLGPELLGFPDQIHQIEVTLLSWDSAGEGGFRPLNPKATAYSFGGGMPYEPLWMDRMRLTFKNHWLP